MQKQSMQEDVTRCSGASQKHISKKSTSPWDSDEDNICNICYMQLVEASRTATLSTLVTATRDVMKNKAALTAQKLL